MVTAFCAGSKVTGSMKNFMSLICDEKIAADYIAIADQDDVWLPEKLSRALALVGRQEGRPVLYGGRTIIVAENLSCLGTSPAFRRTLGFRNALVQSFAGGNTMLLNRAARELVIRGGDGAGAVCHDWWLYQLVSGAGGHVIYDTEPMVLYRQHDGNQIGSNNSLKAKFDRVRELLRGRYRNWNGRNIEALRSAAEILTPENRQILASFERLREVRGPRALALLKATGLYRQTRAGNMSLALASLIGCL